MNSKQLIFIVALFMTLTGCHHSKNDDYKSLSAGQTVKPNTNYTVTKKSEKDYEEPHNTRVEYPYKELIPNLSPNVPTQLRPHSRLVLTDVEDRTFFDFFAWQTFVGLVWPADSNYRGVPNRKIDSTDFAKYNTNDLGNPNRVPVVWETFQTFDSLFPVTKLNPNVEPQKWNATAYTRPFNLGSTSKGKSHEALDEAFSSPLIDQNRQYVLYNLQMNEVMYEFIRQNKWYLKENLPKSPTQASLPPLPVDPETGKIISSTQPQTNTIITQPVNGNSIEIKSAWRVMITEEDSLKPWRKKDDLSRYFISRVDIQLEVTDTITNKVTTEILKDQLVGLVGLHVVVKTPQFTQGLWSSFEHVDNIKTPKGSGIRPSFHNDTDSIYNQGFSYQPNQVIKIEDQREPVEVSRIYKIPNTPLGTAENLPDGLSTVGLNKTFQKLLKGTVWENYQLVITQWPTDPTTFYAKPFLYPRAPAPGKNAVPSQKDAYARAMQNAKNAYPKWSGLPIPQVGALNTVMETYFQNPNPSKGVRQPMENTSCMGCHYGASDMDYSWGLKLRTYPQPFNEGRINPKNNPLLIDTIQKK